MRRNFPTDETFPHNIPYGRTTMSGSVVIPVSPQLLVQIPSNPRIPTHMARPQCAVIPHWIPSFYLGRL
ncbi:hypothetical protein DMENIID0001_046430 [Sergentomyia squamirostris]